MNAVTSNTGSEISARVKSGVQNLLFLGGIATAFAASFMQILCVFGNCASSMSAVLDTSLLIGGLSMLGGLALIFRWGDPREGGSE